MSRSNSPSRIAAAAVGVLVVAGLVGLPAAPALAVGTTYYINNTVPPACSDSYDGFPQTHTTGTTGPWCSLAGATNHNSGGGAHPGTFSAGDSILLARGQAFTGWLNVQGTGTSTNWITIGSYDPGTGSTAKPIVQGDADGVGISPTSRTIDITDPDYWQVSGLELRWAGQGLSARFSTNNHVGFHVTDVYFHDMEVVVPYDGTTSAPYGVWNSSSIYLDAVQPGAPALTFGDGSDWVLKDIVFDRIVVNNTTPPGFVAKGDPVTGSQYNDLNRGSWQDVVIKNSTFTNTNGPLGAWKLWNAKIYSNTFSNVSKLYASAGTTAIFLFGGENVEITNNRIGLVPHTTNPVSPYQGATDQSGIDVEAYNDNIDIHGNFFHDNAGPGIEILSLGGLPTTNYNSNLDIQNNTFVNNDVLEYQWWNSTPITTGSIATTSTDMAGTATNNLFSEEVGFNNYVPPAFSLSGNKSVGSPYVVSNPSWDFLPSPWGAESRSGSTYSNLSWDGTNLRYGTASEYVSYYNHLPASGSNKSAVRTWTAPKTGTVNIRGWVAKNDPTGDGVTVSITRAGTVIWPASGTPQSISASDTTGLATMLSGLSVTAGDKLRFEVSNGASGNNTGDLTSWLPTVAYDEAPINLNRISGETYTSSIGTAANAFDGNTGTATGTISGAGSVTVTYPSARYVFGVFLIESSANRTRNFNIQYWNSATSSYVSLVAVGATGSTTFNGITQSGRFIVFSAPVTTTSLRFNQLTSTGAGTDLAEFEAFSVDLNRGTTMTSSSNWSGFVPGGANDDVLPTAWQAASGGGAGQSFNNSWLATDLIVPQKVNRAVISEYGNRTSAFKIQYKLAGVWTDAYTGTTIGNWKTVTFTAVTAQEWRILFTAGTSTPIVYELMLYND